MAINVTVVENLDNVNVNVSSQSPIINISVDQLASERAVQAAKEARESADEAKVSEINALISAESALLSEQNANQAKEDAELAKVEAENARDTAIEAKDDAELARDEAVQAKTDAQEFSSQASDARNEAIEAKDDAIQAKEDAELAQLGAETARDAILDKAEINLTTAGNILRADGTTYKAVNETSFLQSKVPFERSWIGALFNSKNIYAWDSFNRPDTSSSATGLGTLNSGQTWEGIFVSDTNLRINNKFALITGFSKALIPIQGGVNQRIIFSGATEFGNNRSIIALFYHDENNYLEFRYNTNQIWIRKIVNNVATTLTTSTANNFNPSINSKSVELIDCFVYRGGANAYLKMSIIGFNNPNIQFNTTDAEVLSIINNMTKVGISGEVVSLTGGINNFIAQSLLNL